MDPRETVRTYYDALRTGEPLWPFFATDPPSGPGEATGDGPLKYGLSETLVGIDEITAGLREQTATTSNWTVDSRALRVTERECHAWFSDDVGLAWHDAESGRREFDTRWSGTLERRVDAEGDEPCWRIVGMHVSIAVEF